MTDHGTITALMPVRAYSRDYLQEAIESLFGQSCERWKLLVIVEPDDLTDFSHDCADLLGDPRISVIANEGCKMAGKLNTGMRHASTAFVAILFSDDLWTETAVEVLLRGIREFPDADLLHSSRRFIDDSGGFISEVYRSREEVRSADFLDGAPVKHLLCWRVEKALSVGGIDESLQSIGADDFDFPWVMIEHGARFVAVPECLYLQRDHRAYFRLTTDVPRSIQVRVLRRIMRKHGASRQLIRRRVKHARKGYLRQCLYANRLDRYVKTRWLGDPRESWREPLV